MSSSNASQQRDRISTQQYQCDQCVLFFDNYQKLQNHKRIHRGDSARMTEIDQSILDDVDMYHDENDTSNEDESVSNSEYTMESMELDNTISYKCACNFEDSEGEAHIYDSSRISTNTFTKAELMSIHLSQLMLQHRIARAAYRDIVQFINTVIRDHDNIMMEPGGKISHGETVDALLKSKSSVKGHEYDVCSSGCRLYGINDDQESCVDCSKPRYKTDPDQSQTPAASMKLMSVGDMLSQMLADPATRELLCYRANRESVAGQLTDIFDGDNYKQLVQQGLFSNPDDIAIGLYTDGFVNQKKGKNSYTIIHCIIFNLDPSIRYTNKYLLQLRHGMYFDDISTRLRPLEDFKVGNPSKNIYQPSIYTQLSTFSKSSFFALDELHLIARGIEKLVYDLITVTLTKETKFYYTHSDNTLNITKYPFYKPKANLVTIGNCITSSRKYIPTSFQGSFNNVFAKIDGTRAVDWLDFLLYLVPTLVVPYLPNRAVKTALLSLVKDTSSTGTRFYTNNVFRPVQHYLVHIPYIIKQQGPLRCYSTRSMERVIGIFSKLIKSKSKGGRNTSFLVERFAIHNYTSMAISICDEINLIWPKPYGRESYMDLPNDPSGAQLWEPFHQFVNLNNDSVEGVGGPSVKEALLKYYRRTTGLTGHEFGDSVVVVAARLWMDSTVYSSCMYRRKKNKTSHGNHYMMFTCPYRNNRNVIVHSWLIGTVQFYFQHVDFYGFPHFLAFVEVMKEHDAAGHDSSVPIVKQRSQSTCTLGHQTQPTYAVISVNDICHQVGLLCAYFRPNCHSSHRSAQVSLLYELVDSFPTLSTATTAIPAVSAVPYLLTTSSGFNLKTFIDSAEVTIDNVKGNEPLPPSAFSLSLGEFVQMQEDEYAHLFEYYRMTYCDALLRGYQDAIFGQLFVNSMIQKMQSINVFVVQAMFHENNDCEMSTFTGQIQYLFVSDIINPVTYQADRHTFAYVRWYKTSSQDTRSEQFVEMSKFSFIRSDFQNILSVHCILIPAAIGVHTTATGNTHMLIAPLYRKIYA
ncbi:C2H2-type zinc finger transcription factor [Phycomyces blakesleeanus NRRL 1555(-)]|uniref:C2H2-type zinc finger transcription factor n=1 Tax=Phycomyces blakesleeanus (strain ATCC 8743b / DSM 1359 / FGSC 10004 / NBRC 33097 / NRRL 1555) TaxID=763407 RepID=A0A163DPC6_PHYB8|nr:C2H2-type zinc finger transcription factor [Phycomyces blakesleeanus NRRL 1555(-)]OAD72690.1 C2H2-type zinc finger transcription factor [Phycomyces blakesleeanus NRRL 1555(-)]|eukprot:XP_018290730.1 C2H2-type zinc finger transcription factor [Phycomyces blakesleeanus NRRL 1555(-)]